MKHVLCRLEDIADPGSRGFSVGAGDWPLRGFLVRRGGDVFAYENRCSHAGYPLDLREHEFLTPAETTYGERLIQCRSHGALFRIDTGQCVAGPCLGRGLRRLSASIADGYVVLELADGSD